MILVRRELKGKVYTEPFSKGILSRTLIRAELNPSKAYEIANKIESDLCWKMRFLQSSLMI